MSEKKYLGAIPGFCGHAATPGMGIPLNCHRTSRVCYKMVTATVRAIRLGYMTSPSTNGYFRYHKLKR